MHDVSVGYRDNLAAMAEVDASDLFAKAFDDYYSLTRAETLRLIGGVSRTFRVWEEAFLLYQSGYLEKRTWETMLRQFSGYANNRIGFSTDVPGQGCKIMTIRKRLNPATNKLALPTPLLQQVVCARIF